MLKRSVREPGALIIYRYKAPRGPARGRHRYILCHKHMYQSTEHNRSLQFPSGTIFVEIIVIIIIYSN